MHHGFYRLLLIAMTVGVSGGRLHAHTVAGPGAVTGEVNRCLMMVRVAATRRASQPQKGARPAATQTRGRYDDYQVPAGAALTIVLRTTVDSASGQVDDPVRATLVDAVTQNGAELIPRGSTLHGKVTDVQPASKQNRLGRVALEFSVIEHLETHSLATIRSRAVPFEATLQPKDKFRDVRIDSGERMTITLALPLKVRLPRTP